MFESAKAVHNSERGDEQGILGIGGYQITYVETMEGKPGAAALP